jgi:hypothetical protein
LQLKRNQKFKTVKASMKGMSLFFTARKRKGKNNTKETVFIVSRHRAATPKNTVRTYARRNNIEKFFRTSKQYLGLRDCQSTSLEKQRMHIFSVMLSYATLEILKVAKKKKNPEAIIAVLRRQKTPHLFHEYNFLVETIMRL